MNSPINRRQFVLGSAALPVLAVQQMDVRAESANTAAIPQSSCKHRTAEDITAGVDLTGRTALITGCSAGIGYETLRVLVLRGAQVYGLARNLEKARGACNAVNGGAIRGKAIPFACEQTDFASVVACADAIAARSAPIDMLICNAGIYGVPNLELVHGVEKQFAVNHLSHFVLVNRLLDWVTSARQGRTVVVATGSGPSPGDAAEALIELDNLAGQRDYDAGKMYRRSKLANELFVRQLAKRFSGTPATANVLSPGLVKTEHALRHFRARYDVDLEKEPGAITVEQGATTTCYVATSPALDHTNGGYFYDCSVVNPRDRTQDGILDALAEKLWTTSEELTRPYLAKEKSNHASL